MKSVLAIIFGILLLGGCSKDDSSTQPSGNGTMQVMMTDAPALYDAVYIVVDSVQTHVASSDTTGGWATLNRQRATYDLLRLVNGVDTLIGSGSLPAGRYTQLRLYIGSGSTVVSGGVSHALTIPSGQQSGLKINIDATIVSDATYLITLDFDANRSIVKTGNPNNPQYILKPVIHALVAGLTGSMSGKLLPAGRALVTAISTADTLVTSSDTTGGFRMRFVPPGIYTMTISPADTLYADTTFSGVSVVAGDNKDVGTINLRHR